MTDGYRLKKIGECETKTKTIDFETKPETKLHFSVSSQS